ncbi:MAG TPA: efflux RND transporter periplasmic adaptor subunit [Candidatus Polarisedimenticolaceae bacterium]|nr:efflux RND transporter periplasmic adaptor subunit [Candidatus Polarisedimenticolaceae bacterium]
MFQRVVVFALVLSSSVACGRHGEAPAEKSPAVAPEPAIPGSVHLTAAAIAESGIQTWKVQPTDLEHLLVLAGTVGPDENRFVQVASNLRGRVAAVPVDLGQRVRKGEAVVTIESVELSHAWDEFVKAVADLGVARKSYDRARSLRDAGALSAADYQSTEAAYLARRVEAETLERALSLYGEDDGEIGAVRSAVEANAEIPLPSRELHRLSVRAPFDGKVLERKVTPGSLVEALQPLVSVADLSHVWVFLKAYEKDLPLLSAGLPVSIRTDAYPQVSFQGRVDFLGSMIDAATRTVQVRATVRNPGEELRPGMFVTARVDVPRPESEAKNVVAIPDSALQSLEARTVVFVKTSPGVFVRRTVEVGHTFEGLTEILAGVRAGEVIVTEGSFVLKSEFAKATLADQD